MLISGQDSNLRVERLREFGKVYVAMALWRRLGLHRFFENELSPGAPNGELGADGIDTGGGTVL